MMRPELSIRKRVGNGAVAPGAPAAWPLTPPAESWEGAQPLSTLISWVVVLLLQLTSKQGRSRLEGERSDNPEPLF